MGQTTTAPTWHALSPSLSREITDAGQQVHYAAQFATALGISYLAPRPDDSHTNLGWNPKHEALCSRQVRALSHAVRVAIRPRDLTLIVLIDGSVGQRIALHDATIGQIENNLKSALSAAGLDGRRLTLRRHYELPPHPVASGAPFDGSRVAHFAELAHWYVNAAVLLEELRARIDGAEVRCWPHHFDIATITTVAPGRTCGAGMLPGDEMYPEPYYYVNAYPPPDAKHASASLQGGGVWNTDGWFGAVLTGSRLAGEGETQTVQIRSFLDSAFAACSTALKS